MPNKPDKKVLSGWKEIEDFLGLKREAILRHGFPVRKSGGTVIAVPDELLNYILSRPSIRSAK